MSATFDRFVHDRLPPRAQWPEFRYDLPELQMPDQANLVDALLDKAEANGHGDRPMLRSPERTLTYSQAPGRSQPHRAGPDGRSRPGARQSRAAARRQFDFDGAGVARGGEGRADRGGHDAAAACARTRRHHREGAAGSRVVRGRWSTNWNWLARTKPRALASRGFLQRRRRYPLARSTGGTKKRRLCRVPNSADDIALLAFTSGTTGKPKAPVHSHRDVLAVCDAWPRQRARTDRRRRDVGSPPLAFTFGLGGMLTFPMWAGSSVWLPNAGYTPEAMVRTINDIGATMCFTAPTFYRQMAPIAKSLGVPTLRKSVSAGEGLPDATRQLWKDATGIEMLDGIGATEMFHIFISSAGAAGAARRHRQGSAGLHRARGRRRGQRGAARHGRQAGRQGPDGVPLPRRSAPGRTT